MLNVDELLRSLTEKWSPAAMKNFEWEQEYFD